MAKKKKIFDSRTGRFRTVLTKEGKLIHAILMQKGSVALAATFLHVTRQQAFRWCVIGRVSIRKVARISKALEVPPVCLNFEQVNELIVSLGSTAILWDRVVELSGVKI